jgi:hypothetical protein
MAQQAKSFELQASISSLQLWHAQGKHREAHDLLAPIYIWFAEGFDTKDLKEAKALLNELSCCVRAQESCSGARSANVRSWANWTGGSGGGSWPISLKNSVTSREFERS